MTRFKGVGRPRIWPPHHPRTERDRAYQLERKHLYWNNPHFREYIRANQRNNAQRARHRAFNKAWHMLTPEQKTFLARYHPSEIRTPYHLGQALGHIPTKGRVRHCCRIDSATRPAHRYHNPDLFHFPYINPDLLLPGPHHDLATQVCQDPFLLALVHEDPCQETPQVPTTPSSQTHLPSQDSQSQACPSSPAPELESSCYEDLCRQWLAL